MGSKYITELTKADIYGCNKDCLGSVDRVKALIGEACIALNQKVLKETAYSSLKPSGVRAETTTPDSTLILQTKPNHQYAYLEVYTDNPAQTEEILCCIAKKLQAQSIVVREKERMIEEEEFAWETVLAQKKRTLHDRSVLFCVKSYDRLRVMRSRPRINKWVG